MTLLVLEVLIHHLCLLLKKPTILRNRQQMLTMSLHPRTLLLVPLQPDKTYWSRTSLQTPAPQQPPQCSPSPATPSAREVSTAADFFNLFIGEEMLQEIVRFTNIMIEKANPRYAKDTQITNKTSVEEMRALIGVLIQSGAKQDGHHTTEEMVSCQHEAPLCKHVRSHREGNAGWNL